jgi:hypothetical protein
MRVELADISASRNTLEEAVYVSVNALSQPSTQPSPSQLGLAAPADVRTVADILDEDSAAILEGDNELESFTVAATSAELPANLSTGHEKELMMMLLMQSCLTRSPVLRPTSWTSAASCPLLWETSGPLPPRPTPPVSLSCWDSRLPLSNLGMGKTI